MTTAEPPQHQGIEVEPIAFSEIDGWRADRHFEAFVAFAAWAAHVGTPASAAPCIERSPQVRLAVARAALAAAGGIETDDRARAFFESHFVPAVIRATPPEGLLTGYYEPELAASRTRSSAYPHPIYSRPADLVNLVTEAERGARADRPTHARRCPDGGLEPFPTRAAIDDGALDGQGLELFYAADPVALYLMHVQGSGLLRLPDGSGVRVTYAGKNGHPYTSVGRLLVEEGAVAAADMTLDHLVAWLRADPARASALLRRNASYIFFAELGPEHGTRALGVDGMPLFAGRSLAVDTGFHALGTPIWISAPGLSDNAHDGATSGFRRLMIAHDVGSAIRGPQRGDVYYGAGVEAGRRAGMTKHACRFIVLLPRGSGEDRH
ncbi:MAG: MltA domain-containing protein [Hyphomicrobiaceae bacterium]|nr:MltA domain-containing protein [Hyphomicrobiaceae bacterium]